MAVIIPTAPTFSDVEAAIVLATATQGTRRTLDLTTKLGAWLLVRIGRRVLTALTNPGRVIVRATSNDTVIHPSPVLDRVTDTVLAVAPTLTSGTAIGDMTIPVSSITGLSSTGGDVLCLHSDDTAGSRVEFVDTDLASGSTVTLRSPLKLAHSSGDRVTNKADVFPPLWLPGGDIYAIRCLNQSGFSLVFEVKAIVLPGYTSTP